jgi:hypothetical protein
MPILNNFCTHSHIDALSFYIYDAGYVIANSIARRPFGLGKADRGQSLLFHKFIQSWVGYELVKILVTLGLQCTRWNSSLKEWSQDLHDIFMHMQTKKPELKRRATEILDVLFNSTVHSGHWNHVQFRTKKNSFSKITALWAWLYWHGCDNYSISFSMKKTKMRMGTGTISKNILLQLLTIWIQHHWQTSTSPVFQHQTSNHMKKSRESVHHWKNERFAFYNQTKSFSWRNFTIMILRQHSVGIE